MSCHDGILGNDLGAIDGACSDRRFAFTLSPASDELVECACPICMCKMRAAAGDFRPEFAVCLPGLLANRGGVKRACSKEMVNLESTSPGSASRSTLPMKLVG